MELLMRLFKRRAKSRLKATNKLKRTHRAVQVQGMLGYTSGFIYIKK